MLYGATIPKLWAAAAVSLLAAVVVAGALLLRVKTTGAPWGSSVRAGATIATLIVRLEPYIPSLHRDPSRDRYAIGLLLHDARDPAVRRVATIARHQPASVLQMTKILDVAGRRIRFEAPGEGAYDLDSGRVLGESELRQGPAPVSASRAVSPEDLATGQRAVLRMLCSAGFVSATRFVAVLSTAEAASSFRIGLSLPKDPSVERSRDPRRIHLGDAGHEGTRRPLDRLEPASEETLLNAAFVRAERGGEALRLAGGEGLLLVYETSLLGDQPIVAARVDQEGRIAWRADTGIGEILDILPDAETPAFIGTRPRVPDKVPEPTLVIVDAASGAVARHSLLVE